MPRNSFHRVDGASKLPASQIRSVKCLTKITIQLSGNTFNAEVGRLTIGLWPCEVGWQLGPTDADTHPIKRIGEGGTGIRRAATLRP
jgi:hypothetical protein